MATQYFELPIITPDTVANGCDAINGLANATDLVLHNFGETITDQVNEKTTGIDEKIEEVDQLISEKTEEINTLVSEFKLTAPLTPESTITGTVYKPNSSSGLQLEATELEDGYSFGIKTGGITAAMLQQGSVTAEALAEGAVTSAAIAPGAITAEALAEDAITPETIADGTIVGSMIADGTITADKLDPSVLESTGFPTDTELIDYLTQEDTVE
jgi:hypothetical protein